MILRFSLIALIGSSLAGFGLVVWLMLPHAEPAVAAVAPPIAKVQVLVAGTQLRPGALLKSEELASKEYDEDKLPPGALVNDSATRRMLNGGMIRRTVVPGDLVTFSEIMRPGEHGFLAAVLRPGTRAVTVAVDAVSGSAGLIWPGDRVDLILTQQIDEQTLAPGRRIAAEAVLRDVRVIAIDQQLVQGASTAAESMQGRTVTLEVSAANAEQVQVATRLGRLSLAVRSAERSATAEVDKVGATWASDVSGALSTAPVRPVQNSVRVFGGAGDSREFKF